MGGAELHPGGMTKGSSALAGKTILFHNGLAVSAVAVPLHTVTAGKTYYMITAGVAYYADAAQEAGGNLYIGVTSKNLLQVFSKYDATYYPTDSGSLSLAFPYPIPIAAGTEIGVKSSMAGMNTYGWIVGWEE